MTENEISLKYLGVTFIIYHETTLVASIVLKYVDR